MATMTRKVTNEVSWGEIQALVNQGKAADFRVGDEIRQVLKDGNAMDLVVAAVNHYQNDEIIFVMKNCIREKLPMNKEDTNAGGWPSSYIRERANTDILALLPDEMVDVIAPRKIVQIVHGERFECEDKLWAPSEIEYSGDSIYGVEEEGDKQFEFYKEVKNRIPFDADGDPCWKWMRSPYKNNRESFMIVYTGGNTKESIYAYYWLGVSIGFCIRKSK